MKTESQYTAELNSLTSLELAALKSAYESSEGNGHDFGYTDDISVQGKSKQAVGGAITSLIKKGIIDRDDEFGQFAFGTFSGEKYIFAELILNKIKGEIIA